MRTSTGGAAVAGTMAPRVAWLPFDLGAVFIHVTDRFRRQFSEVHAFDLHYGGKSLKKKKSCLSGGDVRPNLIWEPTLSFKYRHVAYTRRY